MFGRKTVDSILSNLNKNIRDLHALALSEGGKAEDERAQAVALRESASRREEEAQRVIRAAAPLCAIR